jgi:hypothetical protein
VQSSPSSTRALGPEGGRLLPKLAEQVRSRSAVTVASFPWSAFSVDDFVLVGNGASHSLSLY